VWFFSFLNIILYILNKCFGTFLRVERGHKLLKNLLRREGIGLISLFWEKKLFKDRNLRWVGCEFVF
jgi:hypothetical protein